MRKIDYVKKRFVKEGLEVALNGEKRNRIYNKKVDGDSDARLVALSCSEPPEGFARWSLRLLADQVLELGYANSISHETVHCTLKKEIKPLQRKGWVIPPEQNSSSVENMEMVLDIYKRPLVPSNSVVCMISPQNNSLQKPGFLPPVHLGNQLCLIMSTNVMCNTFLSCGPLTGKRMVKITERRTKQDWACYLEDIAVQYENADKITQVMDNLNTHIPGPLYETFPPAKVKALWDRFEFVYTPKHGRWLNIAEIELSVFTGQSLKRRMDRGC